MQETLDTISGLSPGQRVRLTCGNDEPIELRVNQKGYALDEHLRLELTSDAPGEDGRYRLETNVENGAWTPPRVERYDPIGDVWVAVDRITTVIPLGTFSTVKSADMVAQEGPAHGERKTIGDYYDA